MGDLLPAMHSNAIKYSSHRVFKGAELFFQDLTLKVQYLTLGVKKSKFRRITFLRMAILHISMRYQFNPMKTVGRVCKSMEKRPKNANFSCDLHFDLVTSRSLGYLTHV